jgi:TRAP-type mannitol/chloroaromatic compound transport system permease small subunit
VQTIISILERITGALGLIAAVMVLPLVIGMTYEVVSRYAFRAPTVWAFEIAYMLMGTIFMFGMAYALKHKHHVSVDFLYNMLGARAKAVVDVIGYLLVLPAVAWIAYELHDYALRAYLTGRRSGQSAWNPVIWPYRTVLFIGFTVLALQLVLEIVKSLRVVFGLDRERD